MLDFYYAERLAERPLFGPRPSLEEQLKHVQMPLVYLAVRRMAELLIIAGTVPLTLSLFAITAVGIAIDSPGPILLRRERRGVGGGVFMMHTFRTRCGVDSSGARIAERDDPGITPFGRFLRRHRLNDLPQLWNVLKGEMSLIGPRPEPAVLSSLYEEALPLYRYRRLVRPGITGLAQAGHWHISALDAARVRLESDLQYVLHISPRLDIPIALRALRAIITGRSESARIPIRARPPRR